MITLERAIEIMECEEEEDTFMEEEWKAAVKVSYEAMKRCKYLVEHTTRWAGVLLPGEIK